MIQKELNMFTSTAEMHQDIQRPLIPKNSKALFHQPFQSQLHPPPILALCKKAIPVPRYAVVLHVPCPQTTKLLSYCTMHFLNNNTSLALLLVYARLNYTQIR